MLFIGDDWAEDHHDIAVMDEAGRVLAQRRLTEGVAGLEALHDLLGGYLPGDAAPAEVLVGIETDRGPWVQGLLASGYTVYAINPAQSVRYRQRTGAAGAKSDKGDALVLARIVAVDRELHRAVTADSGVAEEVKVLARAHQSLIWARRRQANVLRSNLREYYPAALAAFGQDLHGRDAMAVLGAAPGPNAGARLTPARVQALLRHAGRQRYVAARSGEIVEALHSPQLSARPGIEAAYTATTTALVAVIRELNTQIGVLQGQVEESFGRHPDAEVYLSQPGIGPVLGARVLGEFGDAADRYADTRSRRNYAGTSPVTRASGTKRSVLARHARNRRLADALDLQAFTALSTSPGARAYYDARRSRGATHHQALRALANRLVGILHGCLRHHTTYNEDTAWHTATQNVELHAA